jgi:hypothetical protein
MDVRISIESRSVETVFDVPRWVGRDDMQALLTKFHGPFNPKVETQTQLEKWEIDGKQFWLAAFAQQFGQVLSYSADLIITRTPLPYGYSPAEHHWMDRADVIFAGIGPRCFRASARFCECRTSVAFW